MLDSIKTYERYDKDEVSFGIERLPEQLHVAWNQTRSMEVPAKYRAADQIVIVGMGGAFLAGELLRCAFEREVKIPVFVLSDYALPSFVSQKTFVIGVSFTGNTEEVLFALKEAKKRRAKICTISSGGKLGAFSAKERVLEYRFKPKKLASRSGLALGFLLGGLIGVLERAEYIKMSNARFTRLLSAMTDVIDSCDLTAKEEENPAKIVANSLKGKSVLFVASEHLAANAQVMMHQTNEMAKQYARSITLPNLNHHFMEGLARPVGYGAKMAVLLFRSSHYFSRNQDRYELTAEEFEKLDIDVIDYEARGNDPLEEVVELLQFGSFLAYYLGILNKVDVSKVAYTEHFKSEMAKR